MKCLNCGKECKFKFCSEKCTEKYLTIPCVNNLIKFLTKKRNMRLLETIYILMCIGFFGMIFYMIADSLFENINWILFHYFGKL